MADPQRQQVPMTVIGGTDPMPSGGLGVARGRGLVWSGGALAPNGPRPYAIALEDIPNGSAGTLETVGGAVRMIRLAQDLPAHVGCSPGVAGGWMQQTAGFTASAWTLESGSAGELVAAAIGRLGHIEGTGGAG